MFLALQRFPLPILAQCSVYLSPESARKTFGFLLFSGGIELEHWGKMRLFWNLPGSTYLKRSGVTFAKKEENLQE